MDKDLFDDFMEVSYKKGDSVYKYKAFIPREIYNKWRPDSALKTKAFKEVKFGAQGYTQFHDKIGSFSEFNNNDLARRENYKKRHQAIMTKVDGESIPSYLLPFSPEFFSYNILW